MSISQENKALYRNPEAPIEARIGDLLSRMTIREKVRQLDQYFGATFMSATHPHMDTVMARDAEIVWDKVKETIGQEGIGCIHDLYGTSEVNNALQRYAVEETRLGIPMLFSEEALHGLCRPGCTVFPHAITTASSWNPAIAEAIGQAIAAETRSFGIHETFGPVLDLAREPRWGRVEETYGEDTHLAGRMAVAMVKGLQGESLATDHTIVAEPKHFAVHGVPESGLNQSATSLGLNEIETYYMPVFEDAFVEGGAVNAMCAYNSIDGVPCASDESLLTGVLRGKWHMPGFVRSDLGAISRLQRSHFTADSEKEAIRQALVAGCDMQYYDYPHEVYQNAIVDMVGGGEIAESTVNEAVGRVLRVKFMLGLFEQPYIAPGLSAEVVRSAQHGETALQAAREGIVLLKNEGAALPLRKDLPHVAVIGPSAAVARLGDYTPYVEGFEPVTLLQGIRGSVSPATRVSFAKGTGILEDELEAIPAGSLLDAHGNEGLLGEYFNNPELTGEPVVTRNDSSIDFNWVIAKPDQRLHSFGFSVRWTGKLVPKQDVSGRIGTVSADSMRLWLDGELIVDGWGKDKSATRNVPVALEAGRSYEIRLEYRKDTNGVSVMLGWSRETASMQEAVELARSADVAIVALGDDRRTCGEGVDRASLDLPGRQLELLKAVYETGTPVILVLQNGRPITMSWEDAHIPAILEAWYPGERGGDAIAEVLFGDYNPAGRLPISFPRTLGQIPVYYNRRRGGSKDYVEGDNRPLYAFGHGLSYTTFGYDRLTVSVVRGLPDPEIQVSVEVANTGSRAGDEVVQLYVSDVVSAIARPEKDLRRFKRIRLNPGERATVSFALNGKDLRLLGRDLKWIVEPGAFRVLIGPSSDRIAVSEEFVL
ncbi:glycoside hydrolase family 3 C-terminal domain-containing protein [Cohnella nanjingensis]|uniref:Glycoside hydrolase family 3 C-terminal domain-containing protein n=1 Tax=Cohnella nanjingensis TaxID=1387779 RepID=A0A7X0RUQ2_9BACL|nr:glycoside hydrolase family 3 N-terminal domain-containing protein [Cohnella nanjingensis]MBB6674039.1 glycoside hydrolase family 3 C-terminal domain-containing protein [Cohnella nanjingensis]